MLELIARVGNTAAGILLIALLLPVLAIDRTRLAISRWRLRRFLRKRERDDRKNGVCRTIADGNWSDPATWSGGRVPVHGDHVYLHHTVSLDEHTMNCSLGTVSFTPKITADPDPAPIPDPHEHELHRFEDDGGPPPAIVQDCTFRWTRPEPESFSLVDGASSSVKGCSFGITRAVPYDSEEIEASEPTDPPSG